MDRVNVRVVDNELQSEQIRITGFSHRFCTLTKLKIPYEIKLPLTKHKKVNTYVYQ